MISQVWIYIPFNSKANLDIDIEVRDYKWPKPDLGLPDINEISLESATPSSSPSPRINLRSATYYTAQEVANGIDYDSEGIRDDNNITTDTGDESDNRFDSSDDNDFDPRTRGDYDVIDDFMDID